MGPSSDSARANAEQVNFYLRASSSLSVTVSFFPHANPVIIPSVKPNFISVLLAAFLTLPQPSAALEIPLSDTAVREAYFLGQRNDQRTSDLLKSYTRALALPDSGPYISEIHLLTPYAQVVTNSCQHTNGYSAQQAAADYHRRGDTILVQIRIELTRTYTYDDAVRSANDIASELNRHIDPEDFWRAFQFNLTQDHKPFEPIDVYADPIYATASPRDASATLRGVLVSLAFDASQFESLPTQVEVLTPKFPELTAKFDLSKLR
jgi:hypothetical protein